MSLKGRALYASSQLLALMLLLLVAVSMPVPGRAQDAVVDEASEVQASGAGRQVPTIRICEPPPVCFASPDARRAWAAQNRCRFLEDGCSTASADRDKQDTREEGPSPWRALWHDVQDRVSHGYEVAIAATLRKNKEKIEKFLQGPKKKDVFQYSFRKDVGVVVFRDKPDVLTAYFDRADRQVISPHANCSIAM